MGMLAAIFGVLLWRSEPAIDRPLFRFNADLGPDAFLEDESVTVAVSPDGSHVAIPAMSSDKKTRLLALSTLDRPASSLLPGTEGAFNPFFSPDGNWIAFSTNRDGNQEIYVMNVDGTEVTRVTDDPAEDTTPVWSPAALAAAE